ncbi:GNAT family N-acetyltransferase [Anaerosporobacter faecicola]|uniref:GNAT family N-acetyltransferase n=1 Tax=Anaerosporobacter faecicola TaxID=2718714 RepID=UPI00143C624E|nr:GNAT family N-acetyltransferase [Anaerosporobacter faecicola]
MINELNENYENKAFLTENALVEYVRAVTSDGSRPFYLDNKIGWVRTEPTAWSNYILYANFEPASVDEEIEKIIVQMKEDRLPNQWLVGPKSNPSNLCEKLIEHGFEAFYDMAGMVLDLDSANLDFSLPEGVEIREVTDFDQLEVWANVISLGLWNGDPFEAKLFEKLLGRPEYKFYVAYLNGQPVTSSMLQIVDGIAAVDMLATLREHWRKGIGTAMLKTPLAYARKMGCKLAVLQASQAGEHGYRKVGFEEVCKFHVFRLRK